SLERPIFLEKVDTMSVAVETTVPRVALPLPTHFSHAEQSFSLKKRRLPFSSSSTSNSSYYSPARLSNSLPPLPPSKGCPPLSRMFPQHQSPWTPLSNSLSKSPNSAYDPSKQQSYFNQCFTNLGLLGRGSFGEVYKVQSNRDGRQYAVKRSAQRFRGNSERNRSVREARNHEHLCPHPHILNFVAAWEECGRLYIQTELCSTSLLHHAENQPPDEPAAWAYLCDLLSALQHLHSHGFVHLDLKPANVLITASGRLKLGDFGLLLELKQMGAAGEKSKDDVQEGDPRYMAPELLRGEYGPAADVFSLGVSILELACNIEVPNGGEGWQQLRRGCLPTEFTNGLSEELQTVLQMMLAPEPSERPTVSELLALPSVRKRRWRRRMYLMAAETMLTLASLCQVTESLNPLNINLLGLIILINSLSPAHTPTHSNLSGWFSCKLAQTPSSIHTNGSCRTLTPKVSPIHAELDADPFQSLHSPSTKSSQRRGRNWVQVEEAVPPRPSLEPKNLLSLFEETALEGEQ
uniref:non-specific serine/threonine protein kinase n=1 Tax=Pundamilia nyererei TaxID=303518 RepID=A0A3B4GJM5_9CICH